MTPPLPAAVAPANRDASPGAAAAGLSHDLEPYYCPPDHWPSEKWGEYKRIIGSFKLLEIPPWAQASILEALHDEVAWDWYEDCDGCTAVSEPGWPSRWFPPCVRHDYDWARGAGGWASNALFNRLNRAYHMEGWRSRIRWVGVTAAWYSFFKWRKMIWG